MECNRDEAARAKEIAENKFKMKDVAGAKKFALKAQSLYPEMEGVSQMLATLDVYIAAENKVNEEVNWYGILDASPRDDNETLKRKYRKLALMLHPDKNSSIGAEGAFKHVLEAWKFLSDKEKRAGYDRRKSLHTMYQKVSVSSSNSGFCNFAKPTSTSNARPPTQRNNPPTQRNNPPPTQRNNPPTQKSNPQKPVPVGNKENTGRSDDHTTTPTSFAASGSSEQSKSNTFWTVCRRCNLQYEYLRTYVNCNILCPECRQSFSAQEVPKLGMSSPWSSLSYLKRNLDPKSAANHSTTSGSFSNKNWTFSRTSSPALAAVIVQQAYEKVKKDREDAKATAKREKKNAKRKSSTTGSSASGSSCKKRKVIGETETGCSGGRKVTYCVTGETGRNMVKLHGTKIKKKICKEGVTRERGERKSIRHWNLNPKMVMVDEHARVSDTESEASEFDSRDTSQTQSKAGSSSQVVAVEKPETETSSLKLGLLAKRTVEDMGQHDDSQVKRIKNMVSGIDVASLMRTETGADCFGLEEWTVSQVWATEVNKEEEKVGGED